ncbi:hypothetical protein [Acidovorax sp. BL-A-41-H1]|uniref:hypothetical protein n=1 Tax=Acidovorax sp. BL-A-41-H1 TaxID=3421102 RepID=UPI003F794B8E
MSTARLLTVVEVSEEKKVLCQAEGCGRGVFKRIHVVEDQGRLTTLGESCFHRLYGHLDVDAATPQYGSWGGRRLTDAERQMLLENTRQFIEQLEAERLHQLEFEPRPVPAKGSTAGPQRSLKKRGDEPAKPRMGFCQWLEQLTPNQRQAFMIVRLEAREAFRSKYGVDPDLPGYVGMVNQSARAEYENNLKVAS